MNRALAWSEMNGYIPAVEQGKQSKVTKGQTTSVVRTSPPQPSFPDQSNVITLVEALAIFSLLHSRGVLCLGCGYKWAEYENTYNRHCSDCKANQIYSKQKKGSKIEKLLCKRLGEWVTTVLDRQDHSDEAGKLTDTSGPGAT